MDITKVLLESLGGGGLSQIASKVGMDERQTGSAMGALVPVLLGAMGNKANAGGADGLLGALDKDHDGSILDDIGGFLTGSNSSRAANGDGILKHVLGDQRQSVETGLAGKLGVDAGSIAKLLPILAPLVMGYLGRQKKQAGSSGFESGGIGDLLGNLAGSSRQQDDGLDIGDIFDMVGGLTGRGSGAGGMLGGLLKNVLGK